AATARLVMLVTVSVPPESGGGASFSDWVTGKSGCGPMRVGGTGSTILSSRGTQPAPAAVASVTTSRAGANSEASGRLRIMGTLPGQATIPGLTVVIDRTERGRVASARPPGGVARRAR